MKNTIVIASQESDQNALLWMQDKEQEYSWLGSRWIDLPKVSPKGRAERERASQTQPRSVYEHTRRGEYRSNAVLRRSSSIWIDSIYIPVDFFDAKPMHFLQSLQYFDTEDSIPILF